MGKGKGVKLKKYDDLGVAKRVNWGGIVVLAMMICFFFFFFFFFFNSTTGTIGFFYLLPF